MEVLNIRGMGLSGDYPKSQLHPITPPGDRKSPFFRGLIHAYPIYMDYNILQQQLWDNML